MRLTVKVLIAAGLLVLASLAFTLAPDEQQRQAPIEITVAIGETGTGRNIEATVHSVRLANVAQTESFDPWVGETTGVWVIVDATITSVVSPVLARSWLTVDDVIYQASTRPESESIDSRYISPGIPLTGSVAFEVPLEVAQSSTPVRITFAPRSDVRLDNSVVLPFRLDELEPEPVGVMWERKTGWP